MTIENNAPIIIGSDHAAFLLKETLKSFIESIHIDIEDAGTFSSESVDYPDIASKVAHEVSSGKFDRGILLCGTGIGMSIAANRFQNIRAALCNDLFSAVMCKKHNNANILVMGGRVIGDVLAVEIVKAWLETPFEAGRHQMRLNKIEKFHH